MGLAGFLFGWFRRPLILGWLLSVGLVLRFSWLRFGWLRLAWLGVGLDVVGFAVGFWGLVGVVFSWFFVWLVWHVFR